MNVQATINLRHGTTISEVEEAWKSVPKNAKISVRSYTADRPGESSYSTITLTWSV